MRREPSYTGIIAGAIFIVLGFVFLLERLGIFDVSAGFVIPLLLVGLGAAILLGARAGRVDTARSQPPPVLDPAPLPDEERKPDE